MRKAIARSFAVTLALASLAACDASRWTRVGTAAGRDTVFVGVAVGRSASDSANTEGVMLAVEHLNSRRPPGTPAFAVRIVPGEFTTIINTAVALRDDPTVIAAVGPTTSGQATDAGPVFADLEHGGRRAMAVITPTATNPNVTRASRWMFRVCPTDNDAARALARYARDSLRAGRAAVLYRNTVFGRGFSQQFSRTFRLLGGEIVEHDPYLAGITEYQAYAQRTARRDADVIVVIGDGSDVRDILPAMRGAGVKAPLLGSDDIAALTIDPQDIAKYGDVRYTAFYDPTVKTTPGAARFRGDYARRFGHLPDHRGALAYDATTLIGLAVRAVGPDRQRVRDWLADVGTKTPAFAGVTGVIRFDATRDPVEKPVYIRTVRSTS